MRSSIDELMNNCKPWSTKRRSTHWQLRISKRTCWAKPWIRFADIYRPEREAYVLQQVIKRNAGPVQDEDMARLFREIMSVSGNGRAAENCIFRPEGTTHAAVLKRFVSCNDLTLCRYWWSISWSRSAVSYGIVLLNSTEGAINHTRFFIESECVFVERLNSAYITISIQNHING